MSSVLNFSSLLTFFENAIYITVKTFRAIWDNTLGRLITFFFTWVSLLWAIGETIYDRVSEAIDEALLLFQSAQLTHGELSSAASTFSTSVTSHPAGAYMLSMMSFDVLAGLITLLIPFVAACVLLKCVVKAVIVLTDCVPFF